MIDVDRHIVKAWFSGPGVCAPFKWSLSASLPITISKFEIVNLISTTGSRLSMGCQIRF